MATDPHPGLRAAADLLYLVNEGVHAVLLTSGEAVGRALASTEPSPPTLRIVPAPVREPYRRLPVADLP